MALRLARDLPRWLRHPVGVDEAKARLKADLRSRDERFLRLLRVTVFERPNSPYLALLRHAGLSYADVAGMVSRLGLEGTLDELAARGVYVTFDEMKGRVDAVRGSARFRFSEADFDNPLVKPHYVMYSSGSGGVPTRVRRSLATARETGADQLLAHTANGYSRRRRISVGGSPVQGYLTSAAVGDPVVAWLHPPKTVPWWGWLGWTYFWILGQLGRQPLPRGEATGVDDPWTIAERALAERRHGFTVEINVPPSRAVRIADEAVKRGVDLDGIVFQTPGEAMTSARRERLERSGARVVVHYGSRESGVMGLGCADPRAADDVHLLSNRHALTTHTRLVAESGPSVEAILLTSLSENAGKILLNAETGDYASVEQRPCECLLGELGLTTHLTDIRSFEKLTGHGVTFARGTLIEFIERQLPARFGGTAVDYQLAEEELSDSTTALVLRVHPSVGPVDEAALTEALIQRLAVDGLSSRLHAGLLRSSNAVTVRREPPLATAGGKVLPFHLVRQSASRR